MRLLLLYKEHSKAREIEHFLDLNPLVQQTFNLEPNSYFLQKFEKDFNEFIDFEDISSLEDKDKIKIIQLEQHSSPVEDHYSATNSLSTSSIIVEDVQNVIVQPMHIQQWPLEVVLPFEKFSGPLTETLNSEKNLSWDHSRELIGHLANYAYSFKPYPNKRERLQICEALVQHYPYLRNDVGAGVGGWELKLLNKLKKLRQSDTSLEVTLNRLNTKVVGQKVPKKISINPKKGELNWAPDHVPGETSVSVSLHQKFLYEESLKSIQNKDKISSLMSLTYSFRREKINSKIKVSDLKNEYPIFFQMDEQFDEFERLTAVPIKHVFFSKVMEQGPELYLLFLKKKKCNREISLLESFKEEIKDMEFLKKQQSQNAFGFLVLPYLLKEGEDCIFKLVPDDNDTPEFHTSEPKIYGNRSLIDGNYIIVIESIELTRCSTFLEAVCLLLSFYYTLNISYPPEAINTLKFLQNSVLKIHGGSIPPKVRTLMSKISK